MDIVKKNLLSIICGVIALICVVMIFFPFGGMYQTLTKEVEDSKAVGEKIKTVASQARTWPSLSAKEEDRVALTSFPTDLTIKSAKNITDGWTKSATDFLTAAIQQQKDNPSFKPLVPGALPTAGGVATGVRFIEQYQRRFGVWTNPQNQQRPQEDSIYTKILNSTMPPAAEEIKAEQDRKAEEIRQNESHFRENVVTNAEEVNKKIAEATAKVAERIRNERAFKASIYADPTISLDVNPKIAGNVPPPPEDMFDAQATLWLQEDICRAIAETNAAANSQQGILDVPVKRLTKLTIYHPFKVQPGGAGGFQPGQPAPAPATPLVATANNKITYSYANNPLGHQSNDFYDVLRFDLVIVVDAERVPAVLAGIAKNRYIMFRDVHVQTVDSSVDGSIGYLYGPRPVVQLTLRGQYLLLRQFTIGYMPASVMATVSNAGAAPAQPQ